ncbi:MAG TPA: helix-hairpin-helix domain-containing protein [Vicinamibacterales bacterium]|nr:helix-hairpin-helix domain-containing protein [Vicinamibacterales bacterium]
MDGRHEISEIPGIGAARARWLEESFGVRSFRDLAALSPGEIERKLKAEGRTGVSRQTIEGWIAEAQGRAPQADAEQSRWKPVSSFVVEFQSTTRDGHEEPWRTAVHYLEKDMNETWAGIDCDRLCKWMVQQLQPHGAPSPAQREEEAPGGPRLAGGVRVHVVDGDGAENARLIRIDKPWTVVFSWSLEDPASAETVSEWQIDVILKRVGPGEPLHLHAGPVRLDADVPRVDDEYLYRFEVATGFVEPSQVDAVYRGSATIMHRSRGGTRMLHLGSVNLGLLCFYEPAKLTRQPSLVSL